MPSGANHNKSDTSCTHHLALKTSQRYHYVHEKINSKWFVILDAVMALVCPCIAGTRGNKRMWVIQTALLHHLVPVLVLSCDFGATVFMVKEAGMDSPTVHSCTTLPTTVECCQNKPSLHSLQCMLLFWHHLMLDFREWNNFVFPLAAETWWCITCLMTIYTKMKLMCKVQPQNWNAGPLGVIA